MNRLTTCLILPAALLAVAWCSVAQGSVIVAQHQGTNDPATEGFTLLGTSGSSTLQANTFFGEPAWQINATTSDFPFYEQALAASEISEATTKGWELRARLRSGTNGDPVGFGSAVQWRYSGARYTMQFGVVLDGASNPVNVVRLLGNGTVNNPTLDYQSTTNDFQTFSLRDEDADGLAELYVDGVQVLTGYAGNTNTGAGVVQFGDLSSADAGNTIVNEVAFIVPEPGSISLLAATSGLLLWRRRSTESA